jgi:integrase/recombinase XerC
MEKHVPEKSITVKEVSKILSIHPQTASDWAREGIIPSYKINGLRRFRANEIEDWIQERGQKVLDSTLSPRLVFSWREFEKLFKGGTSMKVVQVSDSRWFCGFGGFFYRSDEHGIKRWMIWFYDENNKRVHKAVKHVTCKKEALIALEGERRIAFMKRYNPEETEENKKRIGFRKLADEFMAQSTRKNKSNDRSVLKNLMSFFGNTAIAEITRPDIRRYIAESQKKGDAAGSICERLRVMRAVLNYAVEMEYELEKNPIVAKDFPKVKKGRKIPLEMDELKLLFQIAEKEYPHMLPVLTCACMTGMRRGEIETLKWDDVDLEARWIKVKVDNNKSREEKEIPINKTLLFVLEDLKKLEKADSGYVFVYHNRRLNRIARAPVKFHFEQIVEKAGLKGKAHFHLLRHTVASALARAGADPVSIQYMLGHANLSTTEIYLHPHEDAKRKAAELLEKQLPISNLNGEKSSLQG